MGDTGRERIAVEESYASHRLMSDPRLDSGTWVHEAMRLRDKWGITRFFADPARPEYVHEMVRAGVPCTPADNDVMSGIQRLAGALHIESGKPRMRILSTLPNLLRELPAYAWAEARIKTLDGSGFKEAPADGQSDHAVDASRYVHNELARHDAPTAEHNKRRYERPTGYKIGRAHV